MIPHQLKQEVAINGQDIVYIICSTQNYYNQLDSEKHVIKGLLNIET